MKKLLPQLLLFSWWLTWKSSCSLQLLEPSGGVALADSIQQTQKRARGCLVFWWDGWHYARAADASSNCLSLLTGVA